MAHDVFVSYSSGDKALADAVCAGLESRGVRCWIAPRDILPGLDWGAAIIDAITESRVMVLIFSENANQSVQIKREVERAVAKGVAIIPFRVEDVPLGKTLEYFISTAHWFDALTRPLDSHVGKLADAIQTLLARPSRSVPTGAHRSATSASPAASAYAAAPVPAPAIAPSPAVPALQQAAPVRRRFFPAAVVAVLVGLIVAALLLASRRRPPQILSVEFPRAIATGQRGNGVVYFQDKKGAVSRARFDVIQASAFNPFAFETQGTAGKTSGSVGFWITSNVPQHVVLRAVLIDSSGHESNPVPFSFDVEPSVAPSRAPARPKPQHGYEIQAPNGTRFKVR